MRDVHSLSRTTGAGQRIGNTIFTKETNVAIRNLIQSLDLLSKSKGKPESVIKSLITFFKNLQAISKERFGGSFEKDFASIAQSIEKFQKKILKSFGSSKLKNFSSVFDQFAKDAAKTSKVLNIQAENIGSQFIRILAKGMESGQPDAISVIKKFLQIILDFLPQSPAKRGPLRSLLRAGASIPKELARGIKAGMSSAIGAIQQFTKLIMAYFPQSPALLGPLVFLFNAGVGIVKELSRGLVSGVTGGISTIIQIGKRIGAAIIQSIRQTIAENIQQGLQLDLIAERTGIAVETLSDLQFALAGTGESVQNLGFSLARIKNVIAGGISAEDAKLFEKIGIDLDKVRQSSQPSLELLLSISNALKSNVPGAAANARKALSAVGVTLNTGLINFLLKGRQEIENTLGQARKLGTAFDSQFTAVARNFQTTVDRLKTVKSFIVNNFLAELLPAFGETSKQILDLVEKFSGAIQ